MRETLEREIKLAPDDGFVLPELGGGGCRRASSSRPTTTRGPAARAPRRHAAASRRGRERPLAAEAAAWMRRGSSSRSAGRRPAPRGDDRRCFRRTSAARELVPVARLRTRREGVHAAGGRDRRRQRRRARGPAGVAPIPRGRGRAARRRRANAAPTREGAAQGGRPRDRRAAAEALPCARPRRDARERGRATKGTPPGEALGIALEAEYRALLAHDPAPVAATTRRSCTSSASRRAGCGRSSRCAPLVDEEWAKSLRDELGWLGGHLGPARDLDVMLGRLRAEVADLGDDAEAASACSGPRGRARGRVQGRRRDARRRPVLRTPRPARGGGAAAVER